MNYIKAKWLAVRRWWFYLPLPWNFVKCHECGDKNHKAITGPSDICDGCQDKVWAEKGFANKFFI